MGTISKSHIINQASEAELQKLLPLTHFIIREQKPDYHIDYQIELTNESEPSGICFYVQLKGIENVRITKNNIKCSLKTKHLCYYLDKVQQNPVFLFVNDYTTKNTYWLFIQKHLKESITNKLWRKQQKLTLSITKEQLISDIDEFRNIVKNANIYMKELWPSSPQAATKKEIEFLESLDSRFKVKSVTYADNLINYNFQPTEDCKINLVIKNEQDIDAFLNDPLKENHKFKSQNIDIVGSELFQQLLRKSDDFELKVIKPSFEADILLSRIDSSGQEIERVFLTGKISFSNNFFEINSSLNDSPLLIKFVFNPNSEVKPVFDFKFDVTKWIGKPIAVLPYASKLKTIFSEHSSDERLSYKVEIKGNTFVSSLIPLWDKIDFNDYLTRIFNFYTDVQLVDSHYKLNLVFPDLHKIPKKALIEIDELRSLLMYKEYWAKDRTLTFKVNFKNDRTLLNDFLNNSDMRIETGFTFNILGKKVKIDKMYVEINNPKLNLSTFELEELLKSKNEFILLEFITDKNSKIVFRIIEEEIKSMENKYV